MVGRLMSENVANVLVRSVQGGRKHTPVSLSQQNDGFPISLPDFYYPLIVTWSTQSQVDNLNGLYTIQQSTFNLKRGVGGFSFWKGQPQTKQNILALLLQGLRIYRYHHPQPHSTSTPPSSPSSIGHSSSIPSLPVCLAFLLARRVSSRSWMMTCSTLKKNFWVDVLDVNMDIEGSWSSRPPKGRFWDATITTFSAMSNLGSVEVAWVYWKHWSKTLRARRAFGIN